MPIDVLIEPDPDAVTLTEPSGVVPVAVRLADTPCDGGLTITCGIESPSSGPAAATADPEASTPNAAATASAPPVNLKLFPIVTSSRLALH
ncbi:hypothetical protein QZM26_12875 [Burkholderia multivorans]|uniref:hypothetical protein n=1 Tax=Burkholderia multivorans TaxID=87883 RepID=UPI0020118A66|nr:hypothetical protein [Burkholderia multivorans]MDN7870305.1 hypothetical protein [Burkholderia multivorans]